MLRASCHCGAIVLEIARRPRKLTQCNCSICRRYGALWAYCSRSGARVVHGRSSLVKYTQENRARQFWRCKICGCVTHHQRPRGTVIAVNARNMDPHTVAEVPIRMLDGASTWKVLSEHPQPDLFRSPEPRKPSSKTRRRPGSSGQPSMTTSCGSRPS